MIKDIKKPPHYRCLALKDESKNIFKQHYINADASIEDSEYNLISINSFYLPKRNGNKLSWLNNILIDLDGYSNSFPLSGIDVRKKFNNLGFEKEPTLILSTSEGKYHIILRLVPIKAWDSNIIKWQKYAKALCKYFDEDGADITASTNPAGFYRIPESINFKYINNPKTELICGNDTDFEFKEIEEVLLENNLIKKMGSKDLFNNIKLLENGGLADGRKRSVFAIACYYNMQEIPKSECLRFLIESWNKLNNLPLEEHIIRSAVKSAFQNNYKISNIYINKIFSDIEKSKCNPVIINEVIPKKYFIKEYAKKIINHIFEKGGCMKCSQRKFAEDLNIPWRSLPHAIKEAKVVKIASKGSGRNSYTIFSLNS